MVIFGASGHGKVILEMLQLRGASDLVIWDDHPKGTIMGYEVVRPGDLPETKTAEMVIAVGDNAARKALAQRFSKEFSYVKIVHPGATTSQTARLGKGTVVMAGVAINPESIIGEHCIINTSATIDHECKLGDFVHVSPNATLCGQVKVGEGTHVGAGAVVIQNVTIGKWCRIGAGAVILRDVPDHCTVVGNPGRIIKRESEDFVG